MSQRLTHKVCPVCRTQKVANEFPIRVYESGNPGLASECFECKRQRGKVYRSKNPQKIKSLSKLDYEKNKDKVNKNSRDRYKSNKGCIEAQRVFYRRANKEKFYGFRIKAKYGIDSSYVTKMKINQDNSCKICNRSFNDVVACVDHCHKTKKIRGLLCRQCNSGLGLFKDSRELIIKAERYLYESQV